MLVSAFRSTVDTTVPGIREQLNQLERAADGSDPDATSVAASADLSAIEEIHVDLGDALAAASSDAGRATIAQLGADSESDLFGQVSGRAAAWARQHAAEITGQSPGGDYNLADSTRAMIRDTIASGLDQGLSTEEIIDNLVDRGLDADRASLIAQTEVANANSEGTLQAYTLAEQAGVEILKGWLTVGDEKVDEDICQANEDQGPIPVSQPFQSGHMRPLGHARCRCSLMAYVGDTESLAGDTEKMFKTRCLGRA